MSRFLNDKETEFVLNLKPEDITKTFMIENFADTAKGKSRFETNDKIIIPANNKYFKNKEKISTTIGRYIYNIFILYPDFIPFIGYQNYTITKDTLKDLEKKLVELLLDEKVDSKQFITYLNKTQWLGFGNYDFLAPSLNLEIIKSNKNITKRKNELFNQFKEEIENGDVIVGGKIEAELIDMAKKELKDNPAYELFDSGANATLDNNYKALTIMKGPLQDNATGKYHICTSNYMDGVKKEEQPYFADSLVLAAYSRAVGTQTGGYESKKMFASFQNIVLDEKDSDCGSKNYLQITLTKANVDMFLYRYMIESNGSLTLLGRNNMNKYIGRLVKFRSPMYCIGKKICNKCAGEMYYKLGIMNAGLTTSRISSSILNMNLKKFHNVSVKLNKIDFKSYLD